MVCNDISKASASSGICSRTASRNPNVHGAALPPLHFLPLPGAKDRHAEGPDECIILGARAHHRGMQEPGQKPSHRRYFSLCDISVSRQCPIT